MDSNARQLILDGNYLFNKKSNLLNLWQEIALNFYPERADFTYTRNLGTEYAEHLMNSYPVLARRDLANSFGSMLRKDNWFQIGVRREPDGAGKSWLDWATGVQRRAMYDRVARFNRATKEGDHDFASFGQCAITIELGSNRDALLYRCWHLRDLAWAENSDGAIDTVHLKWKPTVRQLCQMYPKTVSPKITERLQKDQNAEVPCRRIVLPSNNYDAYGMGKIERRLKVTIVDIDEENQNVMQERSVTMSPWVIPRWQTVSGSQYAHSPATIVTLPDARLIQAMTLTLLNAGEKAADPPMLAVQDAIRGDVDIRAGGITWVDAAYDEKLQQVLQPITHDYHQLSNGIEMSDRVAALLKEGFYLNKLSLPPVDVAGGMTAYEVSQRVQEYIRQALPLFEPLETEYNAALCENTFQLMLENGAFGSPNDIPQSLRKQDIEFKFISPLRTAVDREKGTELTEALNLIAASVQVDPTASANFDVNQALRDALEGIGVPARWIRDESDAAAEQEKISQEQQAAKIAAFAQAAAKATPAGVGAGVQANAGTSGVGGPFGQG